MSANSFDFDDFEDDFNKVEETFNENTQPSTPALQKESEAGSAAPKGKLFSVGLYEGISNEDYHRSRGESSSNLKPACKSMELYHETRSGRVPFNESPAMRLGSLIHKLTLERLDFQSEYIVAEKFNNTNQGREDKQAFHDANPGKVVISPAEYETASAMADKLLAYPEVVELGIFESGIPERSGYYTDPDTGILCKYRPDWENDFAMFDVKSCKDASEKGFASSMIDFKYPLSAAHYLTGDKVLNNREEFKPFFFLCVESKYPYECAVYQIDEMALDLGLWQRGKALKNIKECRESGEWPLLNDGIGRTIKLPNFAYYEMEKANI